MTDKAKGLRLRVHRGRGLMVTAGHLHEEQIDLCPVSELEEVEREKQQAEQQAASMRRDLAAIRDEPVTGAEVEWIVWAREIAATCLSQPPTDVEEGEWQVGDVLRHAIGSEWELIEHIGGCPDDWRARCVKPAPYSKQEGETRVFHREYMDRSLTRKQSAPQQHVEQPERCGGAAGEGEDAVEVIARLAPRASAGKLLSDLAAEGWKLVHAVQQGGEEDG